MHSAMARALLCNLTSNKVTAVHSMVDVPSTGAQAGDEGRPRLVPDLAGVQQMRFAPPHELRPPMDGNSLDSTADTPTCARRCPQSRSEVKPLVNRGALTWRAIFWSSTAKRAGAV